MAKRYINLEQQSIEDRKYIIPHQSNLKMMKSMCEKLEINTDKMYINIGKVR